MRSLNAQREVAGTELTRSYDLAPYEAVDVAWVAVMKLANLLPGRDESKRLHALLDRLPDDRIRSIMFHRAIDTLLNLDPPLESLLSMPHERLNVNQTAQEIAIIREHRIDKPKCALISLAKVLKRVRNRRAHGFKTPYDSRDQRILGATASLLQAIGETAANVVGN